MMDPSMRRVAVMLALFTAALAGCIPPRRTDIPHPAVMPHYVELAERYDANLAGLDRLWANATVRMKWVEKRRQRSESGEGVFMTVLPARMALSVGKLGNTLFWAGCDGQRYWLFDLTDDGVAYVGRHENVGQPGTQPFPAPVLPLQWPTLMGLTLLDPAVLPVPEVGWSGTGHYVIQPRPGVRMLIEPDTALPSRIDLLASDGTVAVSAALSRPERVAVSGRGEADGPRIQTVVQLTVPGRQGTMTLKLSDPTDGRDEDRIRDGAFQFERLLKAYKPASVVDLDRPSRD